jgi:hypothetical protein
MILCVAEVLTAVELREVISQLSRYKSGMSYGSHVDNVFMTGDC